MVYEEKFQDLFTVPDEYYLAHCISADFGMGKGIAVDFNKRFQMKQRLQVKYPDYQSMFERHRIGGDCILEGRVLNLVTKERYWEKPTIVTMIIALKKMREVCMNAGIGKVAMPMIGAGLGRLAWDNVSAQIQRIFGDTNMEILVCKLK